MKGILIKWGTPIVGRERPAIEEFASFMQWASNLKKEGKISRFEVFMPMFGQYEKMAGFSVIEGPSPQVNAITESEDFRKRIDRVISVAQSVSVDLLDTGDDVANRMKLYGSAIQQLKL